MKILKRILLALLVIIILAGAGGLIYLSNLKNRAVPDYAENVDLEGLTSAVTVYRDSLGIPHVIAENEADLYRVVGYVMAQDRLWQMDLLRRITTGRLSEVLDPGLVDADKLFRALDFSGKSAMVMKSTDPSILNCVEAFSDGVNQYIRDNQKNLSFEFAMLGYTPDPWESIHSFNLIGYMAWDLSSGWNTDMALYKIQQVVPDTLLRELLPDLACQEVPVFPGFMSGNTELALQSGLDQAISLIEEHGLQVFEASNNWAVSGAKSETGKPIMANDMHLGLMAPGIWYPMHQVVKGKINVTGVVLPGAPYVIAGHNEDIGWGMTNVTVDDLDFYLETINPNNPDQYLVDGEWRDMRIVEEKITVKGIDEAVIHKNRYTHRGPVVSEFRGVADKVLSCAWQGAAFSNELRTVHLLNRAADWEDFRSALSTFNSVSQNVVYADRQGNIGLQTSAGVPIRHSGGILVYPGDTSLYDWQGVVPFEELPYSYNPECGYVSSANNKTVGPDYPYYIGTWFSLPSRIGRIREMLEEKDVLGTEDFKAMLRDERSHRAMDMVPVYLNALSQEEGLYAEGVGILTDWDYEMSANSSAALIFEYMWLDLLSALFEDELGEEHFKLMLSNNIIARNLVHRMLSSGGSGWCDDVSTTDKVEGFDDNIRTAFHASMDKLEEEFGSDPHAWEWGDIHAVAFQHPLGGVDIVEKLFKVNRGPYSVGGSFHTVRPYTYPIGSGFIANHGASERHIFHTADWDQSLMILPTGASGVPASPYYMNQTEMYVKDQYRADYFSLGAIEENFLFRAEFF